MGLKMGDYDFVADQPKSYAQKLNPFKRQEVTRTQGKQPK